mmetsp:Transcript_15085/g.32969  ORF Transcript_15085/g.32969 Transcript_15085/m.32969 type:complete len:203 (-) Transcript_15085:1524-2132(-)
MKRRNTDPDYWTTTRGLESKQSSSTITTPPIWQRTHHSSKRRACSRTSTCTFFHTKPLLSTTLKQRLVTTHPILHWISSCVGAWSLIAWMGFADSKPRQQTKVRMSLSRRVKRVGMLLLTVGSLSGLNLFNVSTICSPCLKIILRTLKSRMTTSKPQRPPSTLHMYMTRSWPLVWVDVNNLPQPVNLGVVYKKKVATFTSRA